MLGSFYRLEGSCKQNKVVVWFCMHGRNILKSSRLYRQHQDHDVLQDKDQQKEFIYLCSRRLDTVINRQLQISETEDIRDQNFNFASKFSQNGGTFSSKFCTFGHKCSDRFNLAEGVIALVRVRRHCCMTR